MNFYQKSLTITSWSEYKDQEQQQKSDLESKGRFGPNEKEYIRKDGSRFPIRLKGFILEDVDGTKLVWGVIEDISNEYQRIFEALQDAYMQFDLSYNLIMVNQGTVKMFGYTTKDEMISKNLGELFADHLILEKIKNDLKMRYNLSNCIYKCVKKDGTSFWISFNAQHIKDNKDKTVSFEGVMRDITERRRLEEDLVIKGKELEASEERLRLIVESIFDTIVIIDAKGIVKFRSSNNERLFGVESGSVVGENSFDFVHPDDRERLRRELAALIRDGDGALRTGEFKYLRKDGSTVMVELEGRNMLHNKLIGGFLLTFRDITQKKVADRKIKEESEKLKALIESTDNMVWVVDPVEFGIRTFNHALSHYFKTGRDLNIKEGMRPEDLLPDEYAAQWRGMYNKVLAKGAYKVECEIATNNQILELSFYPVKIEDELIGISVMGQDITQRKEMESSLRESEERFRGIISSMDDVVYTLDREQQHTGVYGSWVEKSNLTEDFFLGKTSSEIFGSEVGKLHAAPTSKALTGENVAYEWDLYNGNERTYYHTSLSPMYDPQGNINGVVGIGRNITSIKKAEIELVNSKERFIKAQEMGRFGHWSYNIDIQKFTGSKVTFEIYGFDDLDKVSFEDFVSCISKSDVQRITEKFNQLIFEGRHLDEQFEIYPKGSDFPLHIRNIADVSTDENGVIIVDGVVQDISELKKMELQVINTAKQNQRILDNLKDAYFQEDTTGTSIIINPKAVIMYGYQSVDELIGQKVEVLYENVEDRNHLIEELKRNGFLTDYVCKGKRKDNTTFWVSMNVQFVKDNYGNNIGTEVLVRDISERIDLEEAVKTHRDYLIEINEKLSRSEEKFKGMLETIPAALFLTADNHKKIGYLSSYFTEMFGYSNYDISTLENWYEKAYPDVTYRKKIMKETSDCFLKSLSDPTYKTELNSSVTCKDGSVKYVLWRGLMLDGQWLGCGFDLTQIHEANTMLSQRLHQSVLSIFKIGEMRDVYTAGHQKRVQKLAVKIAQDIGLPDEAIMNISYGALIHDIGKIYIPSDILNKPGKMTNLEYQILQTHAEHGYEIVKEIDFPYEIPTMIYQHHERLDGTGYPQGLSDDAIILESRILAVADVVEAMTSHRPYRPALGIDAALEEIEFFKGSRYDPDVVDVCIVLFKEKNFNFSD